MVIVPVPHCASIADYDRGLAAAVLALCVISAAIGVAVGWGLRASAKANT